MLPFLLGNLLMLGVLAAAVWIGVTKSSPKQPAGRPFTAATFNASRLAGSQPWGKLDALQFPLAGAEETESAYGRFLGAPKWFFSAVTERQLLRYFLSLNLRFRDRQMLLNRKNWHVTSEGIEVSPAESVVYALDGFSRARIYAALSRSAANPLQHQVIVLPRANLEAQLAAIGFNPQQILRLKQLTYRQAGRLCLADLGVAEKILGHAAFQNLVEYLFAVPAYRLRLRVSATSDIEALATYWGKGGREELIKPLLKSLARVPGGTDISVSALLPDFARLRLYRYADAEHDGPAAAVQNCSYAAMNFFRTIPDTNFLDLAYTRDALKRDYEPVADAPALGDVIVLHNDAGELIHLCAFIAEDFVFTKNGMSALEPWTLMRIEDVIGVYFPKPDTAQIQLLRPKELQPPKPPDSA